MHKRIATLVIFLALALSGSARAAELHPPAEVKAGSSFKIVTGGSGQATLYLIGPYSVSKRLVNAGSEVAVEGGEVEHAGRYRAILCAGNCTSADFLVRPAEAARLSMLVHPSRVPVADVNAISAVTFVFDRFHNLVTAPTPVEFKVIPKLGPELSQTRTSDHGVAWVRMTSDRKEGPVKIGAVLGKTSEIRVVQQVAADACHLHIKSTPAGHNVLLETDPVRDCAGNSVPDGTVVSFTKVDDRGKTTVDVPIKKGIAKVEVPVAGTAHITVASGVVTGNELSLAGGH